MSFIQKLRQGIPTLSIELFPPKNPAGWGTLYNTLAETAKQSPDFISVTYGAGGSTRSKTVDIVGRIQSELNIESMAHLTCVGHSQDEIDGILKSLEALGINNVLALRGDPPRGDTSFKPHPQGFGHATDLIGYVKNKFNLNIGCAFYPEKHVEAKSTEKDIEFLKLKQDRGADFAISQLFFDNDHFYRFREKAVKAGVTIPLIAGIMPVLELSQLKRFKELSGCSIPESLIEFLGNTDVTERGVQFAVQQCENLLANGIGGIHIYCLNRHHSAVSISQDLRSKGHFPVPSLASSAS